MVTDGNEVWATLARDAIPPARTTLPIAVPPEADTGDLALTRTQDAVDRDPRIAFLITSSGVGGAEHQVRDLVLGLRSRGREVAAVSMLPMGLSFEGLATAGIPTFSLGMKRGSPDPRALLRLRTWLNEWRPDVLHAHMVHANLLARLSRIVTRTPVVISTMHNQNQGSSWRYLAYRLTDRLSDVTTSVSAAALQEAIRKRAAPAGRILLVPNGVDILRYDPDEDTRIGMRRALGDRDGFLWLAAGRLTEAKDYPNLIAACVKLQAAREGWRLAIAGSGPLESALRAMIVSAGLEGRVELLGQRPDMPDLMRAADAYVLSSAWEGLPLVLLEASASGLPVVATDVGGDREAVIDGETGLLVPSGDGAALASAMQHVMDRSPEERLAMGAAGRRHVLATFDMDAILDRWEDIYVRAVAASRRGW